VQRLSQATADPATAAGDHNGVACQPHWLAFLLSTPVPGALHARFP
jgi:hypothetical protein